MTGYLDMHCHLIPGVDDGSKDLEMSMEMLWLSYEAGVRGMILTPHYRVGMFETNREEVDKSFRSLTNIVKDQYPDLDLYLGCEFHDNPFITSMIQEDARYRMNSSSYVLIEFSGDKDADHIEQVCSRVKKTGYLPIIAHMERIQSLRHGRALLRLRSIGTYFQINADSLIGIDGWSAKRWCRAKLKEDLVDFIGSDAHNITDRASHLGDAAEWLEANAGIEIASRILIDNPKRVIQNQIIRA